jgi:DNA-binding CsgD family transcriptional regulator
MPSEVQGVGRTIAAGTGSVEGLTKRQREVLERLELGYPVKKIARDIGVTRNAVYQTIERLRRRGALPETFTPSGQPPRRPGDAGRLDVGAAGLGAAALAPRQSGLAGLRALVGEEADAAAYAEAIEAAIAAGDVAALAYELGRAEAEGRADLSARIAEAGLRRLGVLDSGTESV